MKVCLGGFWPENQISQNLRYYENIKVIEINEIIADTILICQVFCKIKKLRFVWNICTKQGPEILGFYSKTQPQPLTMQLQYIVMRNWALQPFQDLFRLSKPINHSHLFQHPPGLFQVFNGLIFLTLIGIQLSQEVIPLSVKGF